METLARHRYQTPTELATDLGKVARMAMEHSDKPEVEIPPNIELGQEHTPTQ